MRYLTIILFVVSCKSKAQLPVEIYNQEISKIKTAKDVESYWKTLNHDDQNVLMQTQDMAKYDSISISYMLRTALFYERFSDSIFNHQTVVPTLNLIHNLDAKANVAFWPIIKARLKKGGTILEAGGGYPAYQLEGISYSYYDYSLYGQTEVQQQLAKKLNTLPFKKVSTELQSIYQETKNLQTLKPKTTIGKWYRQAFKNNIDEDLGYFEIIEMNDNNLYLKRKHRLLKVITSNKTENTSIFKIENEPFGWYYKLQNGNLSLINNAGQVLISYRKF